MLKIGVIEPADSKWAAPIVLAPKYEGYFRFCVVYRMLNDVTVCNSYHILKMDEGIDLFGDNLIFPALDANCSCLQVETDDTGCDNRDLTLHYRLFRFSGMQFGLHCAPDTFQRTMDVILLSIKWQLSLEHLNCTFIFVEMQKNIYFKFVLYRRSYTKLASH